MVSFLSLSGERPSSFHGLGVPKTCDGHKPRKLVATRKMGRIIPFLTSRVFSHATIIIRRRSIADIIYVQVKPLIIRRDHVELHGETACFSSLALPALSQEKLFPSIYPDSNPVFR